MNDAVRMLARSEGRRRRASLIWLGVFIAVVTAIVLGGAAGARRTASVYDRFLAATNAPNAVVLASWPGHASDPDEVLGIADDLARLDGVIEVAPEVWVAAAGISTERDFGIITGPDSRYLEVGGPVVIQGRLPSTDNEVALNANAAREFDLGVGDQLEIETITPETANELFLGGGFDLDGPAGSLDIVGVVRDPYSLFQQDGPLTGYAAPSFSSRTADSAAFTAFYYMRTDPDVFDLASARELLIEGVDVERAEISASVGEISNGAVPTGVRTLATGLWLFTAIAAIAGLLALTQAMARQVGLARGTGEVARSLGMTSGEVARGVLVPIAIAVCSGAIVGAVLAWLGSSRFPIGSARRAEIDRSLRFDPLVHMGGAAVLILALVLIAMLLVHRQASAAPMDARSSRTHVSRWSVPAQWLSPPVTVGWSSVVTAASGRTRGIRSTTAIAGAVLAVAGTTAIAVFVTSRDAAADDPTRFGWVWDAQPDLSGDPLVVVEQLAADDRVDAVGGVVCATFGVRAELVQACAFEVFAGTLDPPITAGRLPTSPDEIALGSTASSATGAEIGDMVDVTAADGSVDEMRVVGAVVNPVFGEADRPGDGAIVTAAGLERLAGQPVLDLPYAWLVLGFPDDADRDQTIAELSADYPLDFTIYSAPRPPELLTQLDTVRPILLSVTVFLAMLGAVGLLHFLALSTRLRRGEFAIVRALGFLRRQVAWSVVCQAVAVALIGLVAGVPLGIVIGRSTWLAAVDQIGMIDTPTISLLLLISILGISIIGAAVVSAAPGIVASRRPPAADLREE